METTDPNYEKTLLTMLEFSARLGIGMQLTAPDCAYLYDRLTSVGTEVEGECAHKNSQTTEDIFCQTFETCPDCGMVNGGNGWYLPLDDVPEDADVNENGSEVKYE